MTGRRQGDDQQSGRNQSSRNDRRIVKLPTASTCVKSKSTSACHFDINRRMSFLDTLDSGMFQ
jgi:hypothetical protein